MNSKQRIQTILEHSVPDRPGLGFFAIDSDIAGKVLGRDTYWRNKAASQVAFWEGRRDEVVQSWKEDGIELYKKLDIIDIVPVCCGAAGLCPAKNEEIESPKQVDDVTWRFDDGRVYKYSPITNDFTMTEDPGMWSREFNVDELLWDGVVTEPDESIFEVVDAFIEAFGDDRFVLGPSEEQAWFMFGGFERGLLEVGLRGEDVKKVYLSQVEKAIAHDKFYIRKGQSGVFYGTDISSQKGPMISPQMYKDLFFEGFRDRVTSVKSLGQKVLKHMCGNNWPILDIMADTGIDCYQAIQQSAGMDIEKVHEKYAGRFTVWGGVQVETLIGGEPDGIRGQVDNRMRNLGPKGDFILGTSHSVAVGSKYENFMALLDEFSKYI